MVITDVLSPIYLKLPTVEDWQETSRGFYELWNLPNCVGAIDDKHVLIRAPPNSGSLCFNYKKHSVLFYWRRATISTNLH